MNRFTTLPPHLERFVLEQIAAGRFHSECELIRTALQLLETSSLADTSFGRRPQDTATGSTRHPARPATTGRWEPPPERVAAAGTGVTQAPARRSPRGLLADLRSDISSDDLRDARSEMWGGLGPGGAG